MLTDDFSKKLDTLSGLKLIVPEMRIVDMLKLSARIYRTQSHELRVQLMKHQLMEVYGNWEGKRSLFKYGANHLSKAESFLELPTSMMPTTKNPFIS